MFYDDIEDCSFWGNVKFFVSLPFIYLIFGLPMIWDWLVAKKRVTNSKLKSALGWTQMPIRAEDGMRDTLWYFRQEGGPKK